MTNSRCEGCAYRRCYGGLVYSLGSVLGSPRRCLITNLETKISNGTDTASMLWFRDILLSSKLEAGFQPMLWCNIGTFRHASARFLSLTNFIQLFVFKPPLPSHILLVVPVSSVAIEHSTTSPTTITTTQKGICYRGAFTLRGDSTSLTEMPWTDCRLVDHGGKCICFFFPAELHHLTRFPSRLRMHSC